MDETEEEELSQEEIKDNNDSSLNNEANSSFSFKKN